MALWELEEFQSPQFLGFVRNIPVPENFRGDTWLPSQTVDDIDVEWIKGARERRVMAKVIAYDAEAPIGPKPGLGERIRMELPPVKLKERIGEKEILKYKQPRAGTSDQQAAINSIYDISTRLTRSVQARVEWLQMQALSEPTVAYNDAGVQFEVDYGIGKDWDAGVDADLSTYWDDTANADPVADLQVLNQWSLDTYGVPLARVVMSSRARAYFLQNEKARALVRGTGTPVAEAILTNDEVARLTALYGLPTIDTYDVQVESEAEDGTITSVRTMDYHRMFALPAQQVGNTLWGPTAEAISQFSGTTLSTLAPGLIVKTYGTEEPVAEWVKAAAVVFPSLPSAELLQQVEVLSSSV
jgi:hypothetical protein